MRALALVALLVAGCALTSKSKSVDVRYYNPGRLAARPGSPPVAGPASSAAAGALELRLGRVTAAAYIKEKIAFRTSDFELGYYETMRWTEFPEAYLQRALQRALFEERGLKELVSGAGPTLEVELNAFEEVRAPRHVARVEVRWKLRVQRTVVVQRTVTIERPVAEVKAAEAGSAVAVAMAQALTDAVDSMVVDVVAELARYG